MKRLVFIFSFCVFLGSLVWVNPNDSAAKHTIRNYMSINSTAKLNNTSNQTFSDVQTDGTYIYSANKNEVIRTNIKKEDDPTQRLTFNENEVVLGIYVDDEYLVVVTNRCQVPESQTQFDLDFEPDSEDMVVQSIEHQETNLYVYLKDDLSTPKQSYQLEGNIVESKRYGEKVIFILHKWHHDEWHTSDYPQPWNEPLIHPHKPTEFVHIIVLSLDNLMIHHHAYRGRAEQVLITPQHIYTTEIYYPVQIFGYTPIQTRIRKFSYSQDIELVNTQTILGELWQRNRMDAYKDELRVVSTTHNSIGTLNHNLYILDENLNIKNKTKLKGLEAIDGIEFLNDQIYITSGHRLGVIDTTRRKPKLQFKKIEDMSLKVMVPIDRDTFIGIGYSDTNQQVGKVVVNAYSLKSLKPKHAPHLFFPDDIDSDSIAIHYRQAMLLDLERGVIGLPIIRYIKSNGSDIGIKKVSDYVVLTYDETDGLVLKLAIKPLLEEEENVKIRALGIGEFIYLVTPKRIYVYDLEDFNSMDIIER